MSQAFPTVLPTARLAALGQSLWLDNITRTLLDSGTLARYIRDLSVTGLTSNPTIFEKAIGSGTAYDAEVAGLAAKGHSVEEIFFACAISDLSRAADLFAEVHRRTNRVDGWVSLEVSPLLANDTAGTVAQAVELHRRAGKPNLYIKVPGTPEGCPAIEELIYRGVPINVTLLFSREQYLATEQRVLWASTGTKDPALSPTLYCDALGAPNTVNTIPEETLLALAEKGNPQAAMPADGVAAEKILAAVTAAGVDLAALATSLQVEGRDAFNKSWADLLAKISAKREALAAAR
jgi:transaldolase